MYSDYSVQHDESLRGHCTNERKVIKRDKKVRRDVIKTTAEDGEKGVSSDMRGKAVPQTSGCNRKRSVTVSGQPTDVRRICDM